MFHLYDRRLSRVTDSFPTAEARDAAYRERTGRSTFEWHNLYKQDGDGPIFY